MLTVISSLNKMYIILEKVEINKKGVYQMLTEEIYNGFLEAVF